MALAADFAGINSCRPKPKGLGEYSVIAFERAFILSSSKPFLLRTCLRLWILRIAFIRDWRKAS